MRNLSPERVIPYWIVVVFLLLNWIFDLIGHFS